MRPGYTIMTPSLNSKQAMETCQFSKPPEVKGIDIMCTIMCIIFSDAEGVLLVDFMLHRVTVTLLYYADLLHELHVAVKEKCLEKLTPDTLTFASTCSQVA